MGTFEGLGQWITEVQKDNSDDVGAGGEDSDWIVDEGEILIELSNHKSIDNIKQFWASDIETVKPEDALEIQANKSEEDPVSAPPAQSQQQWTKDEMLKQSRKFNIDLTPRLLFSRGDMVELLISSNISRYTEFKSVTRVMTMLDGNLEQVPSSRSDVFNTKKISVVEKRILMKFLTQCMQEEDNIDTNKTFAEYLRKQNLTENLIHFVLHSIAMVQQSDSVTKGLEATRKFLSSLGRFGPTPFLWSMYGTGELPQAFCRLCAVFGGIYYLGKTVSQVVMKNDKVSGVVIENKKIDCDHLVLPCHQVPDALNISPYSNVPTSRAIYVTKQSLAFSEKEQITFLSLPQQTGENIHVIEVGAGTMATPRGLHLVHVSASGTDIDLDVAMRVKNIVSDESLLYSLSFTQSSGDHNGETGPGSCIWSAAGPQHELDFDLAIENAKSIFSGMFPGEEFLPRAPDPEEIVFGDDDNNETETKLENEDEKKPSEKLIEETEVEEVVPDQSGDSIPGADDSV